VALTPDITERLPALLSARSVSADAQAAGVLYDVVLSGVGFVLAVDSTNPYARESEPIQKQQIDTSAEAGEQSLSSMWVRSQTSWHLGAGAAFYEPGSRDEANPSRFRFKDSRGVDVWDQGKLSLLRSMVAADVTASTVSVVGARISAADAWFSYYGTSVYRHDSGGTTLHATSASTSSDYKIANAGSVLLLGGTLGVYKVAVTGGAVASLCTQVAGTPCQPYWAKSRIITTRANAIHEHSLTGGATDSASEIYAHPDTGWTWTGVAETPDAILAAGHSGGKSAIYAFVLAEDSGGGSVPVLGQPFQVAELPPGEEILAIRSYLGRYLGIGTSAGVRVGVIGDRGQVQYGPLLVEGSCSALAARDSYLYAASGNSVIRVNLAEAVDGQLRFPYAYDVEVPAGKTITSLAFDGVSDRVVVGVNGTGTYAASKTQYVSSGWLESGEIRYGTTAPKAFRTVDTVTTTPGTSSVSVSAGVDDTTLDLVTLASGKSGLGVSLGSLPVPLAQARYRLTLNGGTDTPVVDAVAVKAVPVPKKSRLVQYPLLVVDRGRDPRSVAFGHRGYASELLEALEALENSQAIVTVNDRSRPEQYEAVIERVEFTRVEPTARSGEQNFGGVAKVTVRTL